MFFAHDNLGDTGDRLLSMKGDDVTIPQRREIWSTAIRHNDAWREAGLSPFIVPDYLCHVQISERKEGPILVIMVSGRLDHDAAESFREYALRRINEGARSILVDFGGTTFIASMGIGALIVPTQEVSRNGGRLAVIGLSPQLRQLFEVTGLLEVFQVYSTAAEASADGVWP